MASASAGADAVGAGPASQGSQPTGMRRALSLYLGSVRALGTRRLSALVLLVAAGALLEGIGIVMLVPLIAAIFRQGGQAGRFGGYVQEFSARLGPEAALAWLLAAFVLLAALRAVVLWRRDQAQLAFSIDLVDAWRERFVVALAGAEWRDLRALRQSRVEFAITNDIGRLQQGTTQLTVGAIGAVQVIVLTGVAFALAPLLALAIAALAVIGYPVAMRLARGSYAHGLELTRIGGKRHERFSELLAGLKLAKAHGTEAAFVAEFLAIGTELRTRMLTFNNGRQKGQRLMQMITAVFAAAILFIGITVFRVSPAVLAALLAVFARASAPLLQLSQGVQALSGLLPAVANLDALEAELTRRTRPSIARTAAPEPGRRDPAHVALSGVHFGYDEDGPQVLQGVDLEIAPGALVALVGPSGSGKTSIADLAIGLDEPSAGAVTIDGRDLADPAVRAAWRGEVAYVPQDPYLFDRSIGENLRWADPSATDADLWRALEMAEAADFVRALPEGLATRVGNRGSRFSGGERQRLCLARAVLRRPRLLVLDEATSALDRPTELRLLDTLVRLRAHTSILLITHRLPRELPVDRVYTLAEGRV